MALLVGDRNIVATIVPHEPIREAIGARALYALRFTTGGKHLALNYHCVPRVEQFPTR